MMATNDRGEARWTPGTEARGPTRVLTLGRIRAFSAGLFGETGWPQRNLHTDEDAAREAGLPGIIASGTQFEGHLVELLMDLFGESWLDGGELSVRIPRSVYVGDAVTPIATIADHIVENGGAVVTLDVRVENQRGETVLEGKATYRARHDGRPSGASDARFGKEA